MTRAWSLPSTLLPLKPRSPRGRRRRGRVPSFERLEDRTVPTTFTQIASADGFATDLNGDGIYDTVDTTGQQIQVEYLKRGLMEFNISAIPATATINSVSLTGSVRLLQYNSQEGGVDVGFFGYQGDGVLTPDDATRSTDEVGVLQNAKLGVATVPIRPSFLQSELGSSYVGFAVWLTRGERFWLDSTRGASSTDQMPTLHVDFTDNGTNDPPTAVDDSYTATENKTLNVDAPGVLANDSDPEGDPLTAKLVSGPSHGFVSLSPSGSFAYTPAANFSGTDHFTYVANDGFSDSNVATVTITVNPTDQPPVANNDSYATDENTDLTVPAPGVLANDTNADGDPLTANLVSGPAHGTLDFNPDGSFTYSPNTDFVGTDRFTYQASDGTEDSNVATVTLTVNRVNQPPVAVDDFYSVDQGQTLTVTGQAVTSLYLNSQPGDYIGQGQTVTYTSATGTFTASRNFDNGVSLSYTDAANPGYVWWYLDFAAPQKATLTPGSYPGATRYPFQNSNEPGLSVYGEGRGCNTLTGRFTVLQAAYDGTGKVLSYDATFEQHCEGMTPALFGEVKYNATPAQVGVLANDSDPDGDPLTARLVTGPDHGTLTLNANGSFSYTPDPSFSGTDTFQYVANDGQLDSNVATVTITVNPVNQPPVAADDSYSLDQDTTLSVDPAGVLANDSDPDGDALTAKLVGGPAHGTLALNADGSFTYTPAAGYVGTDAFTYVANDGSLDSNVARVTLTVNGSGSGPGMSPRARPNAPGGTALVVRGAPGGDPLQGRPGNNLLTSSSSAADAHARALAAVLDEWASAASASSRVASPGGRLSSPTAPDHGVADLLLGDSGPDWLLTSLTAGRGKKDLVSGALVGEGLTDPVTW